MKSSLFNVFVPAKKGYALYNTLTESILFCDQELKDALESNNVEILSPEHVSALKTYGIIIDDTSHELSQYTYHYNSTLFDRGEIQFVAVTTYACNLACPYCYEGKGEVYSRKMDREMAGKIVKVMQNQILQQHNKYCTLILFGGEPLLNLDVGLYIAREMRHWCQIHKIPMRTFMVTNGTMLTEEKADALKGLIDGVQLTFDGSQPFHDTTRIYKNGDGTYTDIISAMTHVLNAGMRVSLRIQVTKENWRNLADLFEDIDPFLKSGNVTFNIAPLSRYSGMCNTFASHFLEKEERETVLPAILEFNPNVKPSPHYSPCVAYSNTMIFDGSGNIYRCITTVGEDRRVGYLAGEEIVWEPELYSFMGRDPLKIPECKSCAYLPLCGGGCPRTAFLTHKTYESCVCGGSKHVFFETISIYLKRRFPDRF